MMTMFCIHQLDYNVSNLLGFMHFFMMDWNFLWIINVYVRLRWWTITMFNGHLERFFTRLDFSHWGLLYFGSSFSRSNGESADFFRTLNQVKSAMHYRRAHTEATTIVALISLVIILCGLIFYRQITRLSFRSFFRRNGLHSSLSQSNFNSRYQLLTSVVVDEKPASSNLYSNGRSSPLGTSFSSSSSYGGRWRNIWKIYLFPPVFCLFVSPFLSFSLSLLHCVIFLLPLIYK